MRPYNQSHIHTIKINLKCFEYFFSFFLLENSFSFGNGLETFKGFRSFSIVNF